MPKQKQSINNYCKKKWVDPLNLDNLLSNFILHFFILYLIIKYLKWSVNFVYARLWVKLQIVTSFCCQFLPKSKELLIHLISCWLT